jgi:hypothetical protein
MRWAHTDEVFNDEIRSDLELATNEKVSEGMSPETGSRLSQIQVGGVGGRIKKPVDGAV